MVNLMHFSQDEVCQIVVLDLLKVLELSGLPEGWVNQEDVCAVFSL